MLWVISWWAGGFRWFIFNTDCARTIIQWIFWMLFRASKITQMSSSTQTSNGTLIVFLCIQPHFAWTASQTHNVAWHNVTKANIYLGFLSSSLNHILWRSRLYSLIGLVPSIHTNIFRKPTDSLNRILIKFALQPIKSQPTKHTTYYRILCKQKAHENGDSSKILQFVSMLGALFSFKEILG